jgi:hypothetical protein
VAICDRPLEAVDAGGEVVEERRPQAVGDERRGRFVRGQYERPAGGDQTLAAVAARHAEPPVETRPVDRERLSRAANRLERLPQRRARHRFRRGGSSSPAAPRRLSGRMALDVAHAVRHDGEQLMAHGPCGKVVDVRGTEHVHASQHLVPTSLLHVHRRTPVSTPILTPF